MFFGPLGNRHADNDPNHVIEPLRERTSSERTLMSMLWQRECEMRDFLAALPNDSDTRAKAVALSKLDELVMWAKRSIDR